MNASGTYSDTILADSSFVLAYSHKNLHMMTNNLDLHLLKQDEVVLDFEFISDRLPLTFQVMSSMTMRLHILLMQYW